MKILDGKLLSCNIKEDLKKTLSKIDVVPTLVIIQVGNNESSNIYIRNKMKVAQEIGINVQLQKYDTIKEKDLINEIKKLNNDSTINGIIVQLPLPKEINESNILNVIDFKKDIDGLTDINIGLLSQNKNCIFPCTARGIFELLEYYDIEIKGKNVVVVGRSNLVGKPLMHMFLNADATVTVCHTKTKDLKEFTSKADILCVATGVAHLIKKDMVKEDAVIIDIGISKVNDKICGDVDFDNVKDKVSYITPVPGGVGPMTIIMLMKNIIETLQ